MQSSLSGQTGPAQILRDGGACLRARLHEITMLRASAERLDAERTRSRIEVEHAPDREFILFVRCPPKRLRVEHREDGAFDFICGRPHCQPARRRERAPFGGAGDYSHSR